MKLLTEKLRGRLLRNGRLRPEDPEPVVKFFNPVGAGKWLATEMYDDGDTMVGLADLGYQCPEPGCFRLSEMASVRLPPDLGIERDPHFAARAPLSVYAEAARAAGRIVEDGDEFDTALQRHRERDRQLSPADPATSDSS